MEALELPSPHLPAPDLNRAMDELKCDIGIRQACIPLDARITHMLRCKTEVVAAEARLATQDLIEDALKVRIHPHHRCFSPY